MTACRQCGEELAGLSKMAVEGELIHADQRTAGGTKYTCATDYRATRKKEAKKQRLDTAELKPKELILDVDGHGGYINKWIWECTVCGEKEIAPEEVIPVGWEVNDEGDLENTPAVCEDCADELEED